MSRSIRVSEKHGVNPTLGICFWCGEDDGTIGLLGKLKGDVEAPRKMMLGYEPCDTCKEGIALGVAIMEASSFPAFDNQPKIKKGCYPTGRWSVITREAAERLFTDDVIEAVLKHGRTFMDVETYEALGLHEQPEGE